MTIYLAELNKMERDEFVAVLGEIFEGTPAIAYQTWDQRPFNTAESLHRCMVKVMYGMTVEEQMMLMRSHPDLGSKARMTDASIKEQAGVGLNQLTVKEYQQFQELNRIYVEQFGFPFIVAVKNHTKLTILESFQIRLRNSVEVERKQALDEIAQISRFRLNEMLS